MKKLLSLILALALLCCGTALAAGDDVAFAPYEETVKMTVGRANPGSVDLPDDADIEHNKYLDYIKEKAGQSCLSGSPLPSHVQRPLPVSK